MSHFCANLADVEAQSAMCESCYDYVDDAAVAMATCNDTCVERSVSGLVSELNSSMSWEWLDDKAIYNLKEEFWYALLGGLKLKVLYNFLSYK